MDKFFLESVDSTNRWAKDNIAEIPDRTAIYTYNQTAGRGRLNRIWNNIGENNIYASIVLKPSSDMKEIYANLTQYLCVVLASTLEDYGVNPTIKWPNDIHINGKKISGILAEAVMAQGKLSGLVLGVGINLNTSKEILKNINQPATSLNIETGKEIDKEIFFEKLLNNFCLMYDNFLEEGFPFIKGEYIRRANFLNKTVTVKVFDKEVTGIATGLTESGGLKIVDNNNKEHVLLIGDIL